ncbi:hypothetical protein RA265_29470, partial [Pseudomonas syringae pv. tagetis]|uniref:hypothetical protein n=1 Tax=Pseudomonas syringae group genomosp. 7 TaxID=251699 RepID=UPI00376F7C81
LCAHLLRLSFFCVAVYAFCLFLSPPVGGLFFLFFFFFFLFWWGVGVCCVCVVFCVFVALFVCGVLLWGCG